LDYRTVLYSFASFPKTIPDRPQSYRVLILDEGYVVSAITIESETFNIHHVQPLEDRLLLVCARSELRDDGKAEYNGRVYTQDGLLADEILLGDGIAGVQATSSGVIWTSYSDEGVFGNFGWNSRNSLGASGLVAWSSSGEKLYEFKRPDRLDAIVDCYAMNVPTDNDVWCYYYTEFPLVHLRNGRIVEYWKSPIAGSRAFALGRGCVLFDGGYEDHDTYSLCKLTRDPALTIAKQFRLVDESGEPIVARRVMGRGSSIYVIAQDAIYRVDILDCLEIR
jgi:hypothetical protein